MQIAVIGMNQNTAPIQVRNRVAYVESAKIEFITELLDAGINEVVIVATCGRNEIYVCDYKEDMNEKIELIIDRYSKFFDYPEVSDYLYKKVGDEAVNHLYSVTAGLDSIVLGEDQILGQVKEAHYLAMELGASKKILNKLFRDAVTTSKKIKTDLKISEHPTSISYIGVKFLVERMKNFKDKSILVIGTGKMGCLALEYVMENTPNQVYVTNRSNDKILELKEKYKDINEVDYNDRYQVIKNVDAVITATSSPHHVLCKLNIEERSDELHILDLAVPQDVHENVEEVEKVYLYNVDSLNKISAENEKRRLDLSVLANEIIKLKMIDFNNWMLSIKVDPVIKSLNMLRVQVEKDTIEYFDRKLDLDCKSKNILNKMLSSSLKRMIRTPIINLKEIEDEEKMKHYLEVLNDLYGFEGE